MMDSTIFDEKSASELDPQLHFLGHLALALSTTCLLVSILTLKLEATRISS